FALLALLCFQVLALLVGGGLGLLLALGLIGLALGLVGLALRLLLFLLALLFAFLGKLLFRFALLLEVIEPLLLLFAVAPRLFRLIALFLRLPFLLLLFLFQSLRLLLDAPLVDYSGLDRRLDVRGRPRTQCHESIRQQADHDSVQQYRERERGKVFAGESCHG